MYKLIKRISPTLSLTCFLVTIAGVETSPWWGLLLVPFGVFMYIGGGCYGCFYSKKKSRREVRTPKRQSKKLITPQIYTKGR